MNRIVTGIAGALISVAFLAAPAACNVEVPSGTPGGTGGSKPTADKPAKGGGKKGEGAKSSGQKGGSTATSKKSSAKDQGTEAEGLTCDDSLEGVGWCADETTIEFCSEGTWWLLSCPEIDADAFCAYEDDGNIVDCYVIDEGGEECLASGDACDDDADCCSNSCGDDGHCDDGMTTECAAAGEACADDAECCSGACAEDGACD